LEISFNLRSMFWLVRTQGSQKIANHHSVMEK
jgi:hypothetical protein